MKPLIPCIAIALWLVGTIPVMAEPTYCLSGSKLLWDEAADKDTMQKVARMCKSGDVISFPANDLKKTPNGMEALPIIQRLCDFDKTIYNAQSGLVYCVMAKLRDER